MITKVFLKNTTVGTFPNTTTSAACCVLLKCRGAESAASNLLLDSTWNTDQFSPLKVCMEFQPPSSIIQRWDWTTLRSQSDHKVIWVQLQTLVRQMVVVCPEREREPGFDLPSCVLSRDTLETLKKIKTQIESLILTIVLLIVTANVWGWVLSCSGPFFFFAVYISKKWYTFQTFLFISTRTVFSHATC